jgi:hypothetical protein
MVRMEIIFRKSFFLPILGLSLTMSGKSKKELKKKARRAERKVGYHLSCYVYCLRLFFCFVFGGQHARPKHIEPVVPPNLSPPTHPMRGEAILPPIYLPIYLSIVYPSLTPYIFARPPSLKMRKRGKVWKNSRRCRPGD